MTVSVFDHYRATSDVSVPNGVYRVVGVEGTAVTLLQVTDERGRRIHSGTVEHVDREALAERFVSAENPDAGFSLSEVFAPFLGFIEMIKRWLGF